MARKGFNLSLGGSLKIVNVPDKPSNSTIASFCRKKQERNDMQRRVVSGWALLSLVLVAGLIASCGGGGDSSPKADPYSPPDAGEAAIDVVVVIEQQNNPRFDLIANEINGVSLAGQFDAISDNNMEEPLVVPPGRVRFFLDNVGTLAHAFQVNDADGAKIAKTRNIGPLKTAELMVDLEPGTYILVCPLSDHAARGSQRLMIVDPDAQYPGPSFSAQ